MLSEITLSPSVVDYEPLGFQARIYVTRHKPTFRLAIFDVLAIYEHAQGNLDEIKDALAAKGVPLLSIVHFVDMVELDREINKKAREAAKKAARK